MQSGNGKMNKNTAATTKSTVEGVTVTKYNFHLTDCFFQR